MDLSRMLGDVYDDENGDAPAPAAEVHEVGEWDADADLEEVLASWAPEGRETAPATEQDEDQDLPTLPQPVDHAPPAAAPAEHLEEAPLTAPLPAQAHVPWQRSDDDILPARRPRRRLLMRLPGR